MQAGHVKMVAVYFLKLMVRFFCPYVDLNSNGFGDGH